MTSSEGAAAIGGADRRTTRRVGRQADPSRRGRTTCRGERAVSCLSPASSRSGTENAATSGNSVESSMSKKDKRSEALRSECHRPTPRRARRRPRSRRPGVSASRFVNSMPDFVGQSQVINGASNTFVDVFGDRGRHARMAVGVAVLPYDVAVEVERPVRGCADRRRGRTCVAKGGVVGTHSIVIARPAWSLNRTAFAATLHCLTGCAIGEVLGLIIGTTFGWSNPATIALSSRPCFRLRILADEFPLLRSGLALAVALPLAFASDSLSIAVMELADTAVILAIPGAMNAGLASWLFWASLGFALIVAFAFAYPLNRYLIARGQGHAVVHGHHHAANSTGSGAPTTSSLTNLVRADRTGRDRRHDHDHRRSHRAPQRITQQRVARSCLLSGGGRARGHWRSHPENIATAQPARQCTIA